jgi:DNA mismatch repair protein MLH3
MSAIHQSPSISFTASSLAEADTLGQVDHKFIACVVKESQFDEEVIILIDQHAADERIRVERFLKQLCKSAALEARHRDSVHSTDYISGSTHLQPHISVLLTTEDIDLLCTDEVNQLLKIWGFTFDEKSIVNREDGEGRIQVSIQAVPSALHKQVIISFFSTRVIAEASSSVVGMRYKIP